MFDARTILICRLSLAFMWLITAATSFWWARDIGYDVLAKAGIQNRVADFCINAGSLLDAIIGCWLITNWKIRVCHLAQVLVILTYSLLLTFIAPEFWLHPFGPLTKNLPIIVFIYILLKAPKKPQRVRQ